MLTSSRKTNIMAQLHGVEILETAVGPVPVSDVRSSVIGLVGVSPDGPAGLSLITTDAQAAAFGLPYNENTIANALDVLDKYRRPLIIVYNGYDAGTQLASVTAESQTFANNVLQTDNVAVGTITVTDVGGVTTYIEGTDYTVGTYGRITRLGSGSISSGETVEIDYSYLDLTLVADADIIGNATDQNGFHSFVLAQQQFGFTPRVFSAPYFSETPAIAEEMLTQAEGFDAVALLDIDDSLTTTEVLAVRAGGSNAAMVSTTSNRGYMTYPRIKMRDNRTGLLVAKPPSLAVAGLIAKSDSARGYWFSPSNQFLQGVPELSKNLVMSFTDDTAENQLLNQAGVASFLNQNGLRLFGNATTAFPANTQPNERFINVRRMLDIVKFQLESLLIEFVDEPITTALINTVLTSSNSFIQTLKQRGAIVAGLMTYDPAKNPNLVAGELIFDLTITPAIAAETFTIDLAVENPNGEI